MTEFLDGKVQLHLGDCREVIRSIPDNSIDSAVMDPPYALVSIARRFGADGAKPAKAGVYARGAAGFMGKQWDTGEAAFAVELWTEVYRVLKPGAHLVAFGGTRTYHRLASAIEDAGFEIRDQIGYLYGSGFPKSHDRIIDGVKWGTALKPAWEPICLARKPLIGTVAENVLEHGTGALNIDGCRVEAEGRPAREGDYKPTDSVVYAGRVNGGNGFDGGSKAIGTTDLGRWPANIIHDGSDEVIEAFPDAPGQQRSTGPEFERHAEVYGKYAGVTAHEPRGDGGSAARFFYTAKADADDRLGSKHPTVKPLDLMQYLVRLVTPLGGTVLDCFAGTGTTGEAAWREGMRAVLIERDPEYQTDISRRMELAENPTKRAAVAKSKNKLQGAEGTPLFGDA